ncbi:MAG: cytochrome b [Geminicoccaceae bacterium]|nr:cytochrome b [Geminicoccaceae bacterium]
MQNTPERLSRWTVVQHWVVALGVIVMVPLGLYFTSLEHGPLQTRLFTIHVTLGLVILVFAFPRVFQRLYRTLPEVPGGHAPWETRLAKTVQWGLIALTALMPLIGITIIMSMGGRLAVAGVTLLPGTGVKVEWLHDATETLHWLGAWAIVGLFALHFSGAMKHVLIDKDGTVRRMLGQTVER